MRICSRRAVSTRSGFKSSKSRMLTTGELAHIRIKPDEAQTYIAEAGIKIFGQVTE